jgi:hypothetical protein
MVRHPLDRALIGTIRLRFLLAVGAVAASFAAAGPVSAALILDTLRYDGQVRTGATTGTEKHFADFMPDVEPPAGTGALPADNSMLPGALLDGNDLSVTLTEASDVFMGQPVEHSILTIAAPTSLRIFNNDLDSNIPLPVEFDGVFYSDDLDPGEKVSVKGIGIENFGVPPWPAPGSQLITGVGDPTKPLGSPLNPMRVQLGIAADQVDDFRYGFVKINLYYMTMPVPEPTTFGLVLLGIVGLAGAVRSRRS